MSQESTRQTSDKKPIVIDLGELERNQRIFAHRMKAHSKRLGEIVAQLRAQRR